MNKRYAAVIRDNMNVIVRVEERPTWWRARKAGEFFTKSHKGWWWTIAVDEEEIELFKSLINA